MVLIHTNTPFHSYPLAVSLSAISMRVGLYIFLILSSFVLFGLTATRLHYTTHIPSGDPLNNGLNFFDPIVAELCASALVTFFVAIFYTVTIANRAQKKRYTRIWFEAILLSIAWVMLLIGAGIATSIWPNLNFCHVFQACRILTAMVAFAWITWITVMFLLFSSVVYAMRYRAWTEHVHGRHWHRGSDYTVKDTDPSPSVPEGMIIEPEPEPEMHQVRE